MLRCSFCGRDQNEVFRLFAKESPEDSVCICDKCVIICDDILRTEVGIDKYFKYRDDILDDVL